MKKVIALLIALVIAFALVGCNVSPNVPRVTPYRTNDVIPNNPNGTNGYVTYDANRNGAYNGMNGTAPRTVAPGRLG